LPLFYGICRRSGARQGEGCSRRLRVWALVGVPKGLITTRSRNPAVSQPLPLHGRIIESDTAAFSVKEEADTPAIIVHGFRSRLSNYSAAPAERLNPLDEVALSASPHVATLAAQLNSTDQGEDILEGH
jgi:hypothetical protein